MDERLEVFAVNFDEETVIVSYMHVPTDVRVEGQVALQHQARLDLGHPDYAEDAETLRRLAVRMLANALDDFNSSDPWLPPVEDDDEDDERGMGDA